jgi:hypothetical protein
MNQAGQNLISMIRLNPVTDVDESVKRGLVAITTRLENMLKTEEFNELLTSDPTTDEGEMKVVDFFKITNKWESFLD